MAGSGLRSLLEQIYPANAVTHMMTGKAHERAFRGHMLVDAALNTMLANNSFGTLTTIMTHSLENSNGEPVNDSYDRGADVEPGDGLKNGRRKKYKQVARHLWKMEREVSLTKVQVLIFLNYREYLIL